MSSTKIPLTVGRMVWYWPGPADADLIVNGLEPLSANVAAVVDSSHANLAVFHANGQATHRENVLLVQEGEPKPDDVAFVTWMPYQIGQAKKETT